VLSLQTPLLGFPIFVGFFRRDKRFLLEGVMEFVGVNLGGNEVLIHAGYHVLVLALVHLFKIMSFFNLAEFITSSFDLINLGILTIFNIKLFIFLSL
jgi:hypothetical protein